MTAGTASEDAVMSLAHRPAGGTEHAGVLEEERESDSDIVEVADNASYQDQINGMFN